MDALRKQLDVLMGANRNGDAQEVTRKYFDRDVCRLYLAGLCPHELFQLTVRGLEFNSLNPNLLASGTEEGDICIWDISKPSEPSHFPPLKTQTLVHVYKMWWTY